MLIEVGVVDLHKIPVCFHVSVIWLILRGLLLIQASSFNLTFILFRGTFNRFHYTEYYNLYILFSSTPVKAHITSETECSL